MGLVNQSTAAPSRKWKAAGISEIVAVIAAVLAMGAIEVSTEDQQALVTGVGVFVALAGRVAAYFTRNRDNTNPRTYTTKRRL